MTYNAQDLERMPFDLEFRFCGAQGAPVSFSSVRETMVVYRESYTLWKMPGSWSNGGPTNATARAEREPTGRLTMIAEHELIEQIELEEHGRPLAWVCGLIRQVGRSDPWVVLHGMWRQGYLILADEVGHEIPRWRCAEVFRMRDESSAVRILATDLGSRFVHGPIDPTA